jgi:hypothetical protein
MLILMIWAIRKNGGLCASIFYFLKKKNKRISAAIPIAKSGVTSSNKNPSLKKCIPQCKRVFQFQ